MNRRDFTKLSLLGIGAVFIPPVLSMTVPPPITWKDFDWFPTPNSTVFRYERDKYGLTLVSKPVASRTCLLQYESLPNVDYAQEMLEVNMGTYKQTVYTNEILLTGAQVAGFTHIFGFISMMLTLEGKETLARRIYFVRGARLPDWKRVNGKLQVVDV